MDAGSEYTPYMWMDSTVLCRLSASRIAWALARIICCQSWPSWVRRP